MGNGTRARVLDLATRGELTIQQVDYLLDRVDDISGAEAELLIDAFRAENGARAGRETTEPQAKGIAGLGDRFKAFAGRLRNMSAEDMKRALNEEYLNIESNPRYSADEKVKRVIGVTAAACAGVAVQPIPFVEMFLFTPLQCIMAWKISNIRGVRVASEEQAMESLKTTMGALGLSIVTRSAASTLIKVAAPGVGGLISGPVIYGMTYGVGRVMDLYFTDRAAGRTSKDDDLREAYRRGRDEGDRARPEEG